MKILEINDLHVYPTSEYHKLKGGHTSDLIQLISMTIDWFIDLMEKLKPDIVVIGGDTGDTNGLVNAVATAFINQFMNSIIKTANNLDIKVVVLTGNHELFDKEGNMSLIQHFGYFGRDVSIVTNTMMRYEGEDASILFVPYMYDEKYAELVTEINDNEFDVVFSHLDYVGAGINPKMKSIHGFDINNISVDTTIINAHYHHTSDEQITPKVRLVHSGAPYHRNHSDDPQDTKRGAILYDTATKELQRIQNPNTEYFFTIVSSDVVDMQSQLLKLPKKENTRIKIYTTLDKEKVVEGLNDITLLSLKIFSYSKTISLEQLEEVVQLDNVAAVKMCIEGIEKEDMDKDVLLDKAKLILNENS